MTRKIELLIVISACLSILLLELSPFTKRSVDIRRIAILNIAPPISIETAPATAEIEIRLPDNIEYLNGSAFIADKAMIETGIAPGDQVIVIMLKRCKP